MAKQSKNQDKPRIEKLVKISRVAKVVKGGKNFSFSALSVIGDGNGSVGYGLGKALEVPDAIRKANADAEKRMVRIPLREGRTVHHDSIGNFGAGRVIIRSAPAGTGIIAGGALRAIFEALGVSDIVCKSVGTTNPHNMVKAAFDALLFSTSPRQVAARRNKKISDLVSRRDGNQQVAMDENNE